MDKDKAIEAINHEINMRLDIIIAAYSSGNAELFKIESAILQGLYIAKNAIEENL